MDGGVTFPHLPARKDVYFLTQVFRWIRTTSSLSSHHTATKASWRYWTQSKPATKADWKALYRNERLNSAAEVDRLPGFAACAAAARRGAGAMRTVH